MLRYSISALYFFFLLFFLFSSPFAPSVRGSRRRNKGGRTGKQLYFPIHPILLASAHSLPTAMLSTLSLYHSSFLPSSAISSTHPAQSYMTRIPFSDSLTHSLCCMLHYGIYIYILALLFPFLEIADRPTDE
ncbi:MAG: hypothetical protein JOS17DRAFT_570317 [Linnemannia elongata]|nr:MAG: hypothetical protein JOS17DRAFT_570317 [Linnemannia elongata]